MYLKLNPDLFLGSQELNRLVKSLDESGFRKLFLQDAKSFGVVDISSNAEFDNFRVEQGTNSGTIKHAAGVAIDSEGKLILAEALDNIDITNNNQWYWLKISHNYSPEEIGEVAIAADGTLTGVDTEFLAVLRGTPNNPVKVRFEDSVSNTGEYEVNEVISNTSAILSGDFTAETDLKLVVVGAFTPDVVVDADYKDIYQYDNYTLVKVLRNLDTPPALTEGIDFVIARVKRSGATITIEDKRYLNIFATKASSELISIASSNNALIGIEAIKYDHSSTPRDKNIVYIGWGMRSSNWSLNSSTNTVTILGGLGGKIKTTSDFSDGDFDGWRLYTKNGEYRIIRQSSLVATQINLVLDTLDPIDFTDTTQELRIVPNAEEIEIIATPNSGGEFPAGRFVFPINESYGKLYLVAFDSPTCEYVVKYRYKNYKTYSEETLIPDDEDSGYLIEADFDDDNVQIDTDRLEYTDGIITVTLNPNAYATRIGNVETGDLLGVAYRALDNDNPVISLTVGGARQTQIITNDLEIEASDDDFGAAYGLTANHYINFSSVNPSTIKNGNRFRIQFRGEYTPGIYNIALVQDYVSPSNVGEILYSFTAKDYAAAIENKLFFEVIFDGTRWFVEPVNTKLAGSGLDDNFNVNVDDTTIEIVADTLQVKDSGISTEKIADAAITTSKLADVYDETVDISGTGNTVIITIPFVSGSCMIIDAQMSAIWLSGSAGAGKASGRREVATYSGAGATPSIVGASSTLFSDTNDASSPSMQFIISGNDITITAATGSGESYRVRIVAKIQHIPAS